MKTLVAIFISLILIGTATAADYKVTISVTYNAVSAEEAAKIALEVLKKHETACKTNVKIKKNNYDNTVLIFDGATDQVELMTEAN